MLKKLNELFTQGTLTTALAINLSKGTPEFIGYPLATAIGWAIAHRTCAPLIKAIRLNQWIAHDRKLDHRELNKATRDVLLHQARALYNFYHNLDRPERVKELVKLSPAMQQLMETCNKGERGTMFLIPHTTGFDLGGMLLGMMGFRFLTLSYPNPPRGYSWQNKIRNERGVETMPMSMESMRLARERLQAGGTVLTGIDRPYPGTGYFPTFFGHPADLPVAYIKLALKTNARVFVVAFESKPDLTYEVDASEEILLQPDPDPRVELAENATRVLSAAERFIRRNPTSWAMFYPVWPEFAADVP
jgi:KDO2-lipid IV(A) lauroyltransferase